MKTLMTTVMKTKVAAALLSWFSRQLFYLVEVQSSCGEGGVAGKCLRGAVATAWSFPHHSC